MTQLTHWGVDPFDLLWKNLFDQNSNFSTIAEKISYPLDIYEKQDSIVFELAAVGLDYEDIDIEVQGDVLRIKYAKAKEDEPITNFIHKGIARRSFDLAWKIASSPLLIRRLLTAVSYCTLVIATALKYLYTLPPNSAKVFLPPLNPSYSPKNLT